MCSLEDRTSSLAKWHFNALAVPMPKEEGNHTPLLGLTWPSIAHLGCSVPTGACDWETKVSGNNLFLHHPPQQD